MTTLPDIFLPVFLLRNRLCHLASELLLAQITANSDKTYSRQKKPSVMKLFELFI